MFENKENTQYSDDLIRAGEEPIIIKQKDGSDKKFIYTILILLVVLFIIALGVIGYLGSKFFGNNANANNVVTQTVPVQNTQPQQSANTPAVIQSTTVQAVEQNANVQTPQVQNTQTEQVAVTEQKSNNANTNEQSDLAELESIVNEQPTQPEPKQQPVQESKPANANTQNSNVAQAIGAAASATGSKKLTQEEMAKIAKLVAMELAKVQAVKKVNNQTQTQTTQSNTNSDESALVKSLQGASADTLQDEKVNTNVKSGNVQASSNKKVDTFNKVVVESKNNSNDEFAKLSSEIDNILASDDVQKTQAEIKSKNQGVVQERAQEVRFIVVRRGDTLSSLANKAYGRASAYIKIYKANPGLVKNPNRIYVGMKLRVPVDSEYKGNQQ